MIAAYCHKCKRNLNDEWTACPYCGQKVHPVAEPPPPDLAREQRIAHQAREWASETKRIGSIQSLFLHCARAHVDAIMKLEAKPVPEPVKWRAMDDKKGLPDDDFVLVAFHNDAKSLCHPSQIRRGDCSAKVWMAIPPIPAPVPPQKSQDELDREAYFGWAAVELPGDKGDHHDAFRAGLAHARREGKSE